MKTTSSVVLSRRLAIAYAVVVLVVSSLPGVQIPDLGEGHLDRLLHFLQYGVLGFLVSLGWGPGRAGGRRGMFVWIPALILLLFAAADEYHQHWIPGRFVEFGDWVADALGVLLGYVLAFMINRRNVRRA